MFPFVNLANDEREFGVFNLGTLPFVLAAPTDAIGGSMELGDIAGELIDADDVTILLDELVLADGIDGVEVVGLDVDNLSLQLTNGDGVTDTVVIDGATDHIAAVATSVDIDDDQTQFAIFDLDDDDEIDLGLDEPVPADDLPDLLQDVIFGADEGVELAGIDQDNVVLRYTSDGGVTDTVLIDGAEEEIAAVASSFINLNNGQNQLGVFDVAEDDTIFVGSAESVGDGELSDILGNRRLDLGEAQDLLEEVVLGDGVGGVELLDIDDDTATFTIEGNSTDVLVVDNLTSISDVLVA